MRKSLAFATILITSWILLQSAAIAEERPIEISGSVGYTFNDGIGVRDLELPNDEGFLTAINPKGGVSLGAGADYRLPYKSVMLGFHWSYVGSELEGSIRARSTRKIAGNLN